MQTPSSLLALLGAVLLAVAGPAMASSLPPAADFFQDPQTSHVTLSPNGNYVAMVMDGADGAQTLAVRDTGDLGKVTAIARTNNMQVIASVHWVNENRIGFTVKNLRIEFEGTFDELAVDRDGSNLRHLISGNWLHHQEKLGSLIKDHTLTADYIFAGVTHDGSDDILVEKYHWNQIDRLPDSSRPFRLNTRSNQLKEVFSGSQPEGSIHWLVDNTDVPRIVTARHKGRCISSYRKADDSNWRELQNGSCFNDESFMPLFFDGDDILYVRADYHGYGALFRYDLKAMKMDQEPLISIPGFDFIGNAEIDQPSGRLLGIHLQADAETTVWLHAGMKAEQAGIDAQLRGRINTIVCPPNCLHSPVLLVHSASDRQPLQYLLYTRASGKIIGLGSTHPGIEPSQMGRRDFLHYQARDGRAIPAYVTMPPGAPAGPRPAVVLVHGGPSLRGGYWDWDAEAQFLATRGYVVLQPEFRGSAGFGQQHFHAGWKRWGGAMQDDLADAAQWAVKQGWADPRRIAIMGASYGGYATLMGLIQDPSVFRCGVEWAGVTDINLIFKTTESDASEETLNYSLRTLIGDPDKDAAWFSQHSPLLRAAELKQPLLMAHGLEDRRVPIEHASRFRDAVTQANKQVTSITYDNEGHGWRHASNRIDFWQKVASFLEHNLNSTD